MANKATFVQFLHTFIEADWIKDIDEEDVTRVPKSFILPDFRHQEADLVYKLHLAGGRWTAKTSFGPCQAGFEFFSKYALDFSYILVDVNRYDKGKLLTLGNLLGSVFYMEQHRGINEVLAGLSQLAAVLEQMPEQDVRRFSTWTRKVVIKGMPEHDRDKVLNHISRKGGKSLITNFERILQETWQKYRVEGRAEGRAEGLVEGRAEGLVEGWAVGLVEGQAEGRIKGIMEGKRLAAKNFLKLGLTPEQIAAASELSLLEVKKLKSELNH